MDIKNGYPLPVGTSIFYIRGDGYF